MSKYNVERFQDVSMNHGQNNSSVPNPVSISKARASGFFGMVGQRNEMANTELTDSSILNSATLKHFPRNYLK